jgi:hypothetical protein
MKESHRDPGKQSLYSRQIKELETFFGVELKVRRGKGIVLTDAGQQLARLTRAHLIGLADFQRTARNMQQTISIGSGNSVIEWILMPRMFVEDGTLEIDNNFIENAIRPSALGKKNFLFIGHPDAGERSAVIYTLLGSCRRHGVTPFDYLKDLFTRLPAAKISQIKDFAPMAWAKAKAKEELGALAA